MAPGDVKLPKICIEHVVDLSCLLTYWRHAPLDSIKLTAGEFACSIGLTSSSQSV